METLPGELIAEILTRLSVKTILQLKSVNKSWNTLISNPSFIETHLKKSSQNPHLTLKWTTTSHYNYSFIPFPVCRLLENPSITLQREDVFEHFNFCYLDQIVGSCNGLICFFYEQVFRTDTIVYQYWFNFRNPFTRTTSRNEIYFRYTTPYDKLKPHLGNFKFAFGYDDSTKIYKVVMYIVEESEEKKKASGKSEVKVLSLGPLGDNCWRDLQSFPVIPLDWLANRYPHLNEGLHLNGTVNWLAIRNYFYSFYDYTSIIRAEQFVIVSLDLSTETYKQLLLPRGFNEVPFIQPVIRVLQECLYFSHDSKKTEFVLWQMKEYGVQESWTQLFKINYQNLRTHYPRDPSKLVCLYINGDMVILANELSYQAVIYNLKDETAEIINVNNEIHWFPHARDYVESLVPVPP